jgi:antitoxin component of MazEF toxin-antitoxin module
MKAKIVKWEDGLGLSLSESICAESGLVEGSVVDLSLRDGNLIVKTISDDALSLEGLVSGITEANIHEGFHTGGAMGGEAW